MAGKVIVKGYEQKFLGRAEAKICFDGLEVGSVAQFETREFEIYKNTIMTCTNGVKKSKMSLELKDGMATVVQLEFDRAWGNVSMKLVSAEPYGDITSEADKLELGDLSDKLLKSIRPHLKAPMSAVLCDNDALVIQKTGEGTYLIEGTVSSQNSYGAMLTTDFSAVAQKTDDSWNIISSSVGAKTTAANASNFVANYILLSIFVAVMGAIGYFVLSMIVGF